MSNLANTPILTNLQTGNLQGATITESRRTVGDLQGYWLDSDSAAAQANELLYVTQTWFCAEEGTEGAVLWGNTTLMPGHVGNEFFMTRGHWHVKGERGELCITTSGTGLLALMDKDRNTRFEKMSPGSTHYVAGFQAHRTINTGDVPLVFLCAWPADCGHEYDSILRDGFSQRVLEGDGTV